MIFFFTVPLWLALLIWGLQALANAGKPKTIQRQITAPDGRRMTFVVPADEPAEKSIARMYEGMKKCPDCAEWIQADAKVCRHCGSKEVDLQVEPVVLSPALYDAASVRQDGSTNHARKPKIGRRIAAVLAGLFLVVCIIAAGNRGNVQPSTADYSGIVKPIISTASTPAATRVLTVKSMSNIRAGSGTSYPVLWIVSGSEKLTYIQRVGDWFQIEATGRRGWIAASQVSE